MILPWCIMHQGNFSLHYKANIILFMSNTSKIVTGIVVIVLIIGVAWYVGSSKNKPVSNPNTAAVAANKQPVAVAPKPLDTSDASISADVSAVDSQMNGLSADNSDTVALSAKQ